MCSLENLLNFNEVLNLLNEKYSLNIKRDKANRLHLKDIKDGELYINNKDVIKRFINYYNNLSYKDTKGEILKLSEDSKTSDFFVDNGNEFGKSYKKIYNKFLNEQNEEISD